MFETLFQPGRIGSLDLQNRLVMSSMYTSLCTRDGSISPFLLDYFAERARGGVGLILTEAAAVTVEGRVHVAALTAHDDEYVPGLARLAETIKIHGACAGLQLSHCGPQKFSGLRPVVSASRVPWERLLETKGIVPTELTVEEIREIVQAFGRSAARAELAGFDLVELHAAHGYLITSFLSPTSNRRGDLYGGTLVNRMRFLREVVRTIRDRVKPSFPLSVKLSPIERLEGGLTIEDGIEIATMLETEGVDVIHVSGGNHHAIDFEVPPHYKPRELNVPAAEAIKSNVRIPVMVVGAIADPSAAAQIIDEGKADFIVLGRALLADPYWPKKAREGRSRAIRPCIRLNDGCTARGVNSLRSIGCSVNFAAGREGMFPRDELPRTEVPKQIIVVGAGPAGLEAARVATLRGHNVTLFEERSELGGQLAIAGKLPFKTDLLRFVEYLDEQIRALGVVIRHERATLGSVLDLHPDLTLLATGSRPFRPDVPGIRNPKVIDVLSAIQSGVDGRRVAVIGGGQAAVEITAHLHERGIETIILDRSPAIGADLNPHMRLHWTSLLNEVPSMTGVSLHAVTETGVIVTDENLDQIDVDCDAVVLAIRFTPSDELFGVLRSSNLAVKRIGDCVRPQLVMDAVHEGFLAALRA